MTTRAAEDVVVIGGGAVGVCCAEALARAGRSVLLLERERVGAGSSWGNAGLLTTSSAAPEAAPGVMRQASRWLLDRDGPFRVRPRLDPRFLAWLRRFRAECTEEAAARSTAYLCGLIRQNLRLVATQAREASSDFALETNGLLVLCLTEQGLEEATAGARALRGLGVPSEALDGAGIAALEPRASVRVAGGVLFPEDAHLDPGLYVEAVADLARARGARIEEGTPVARLHGAHRVDAVETAAGLIRPQLVVLANGAWAPRLARGAGTRLLVEAGRGFSLTHDAGSPVYERPLRLHEARTIVTSMGTKVRVTCKLDLVGLDARMRERRLRGGVTRAARFVALPDGLDGGTPWAGLRPLAPDGLPYVGRTAAAPNLVVATGHGHLGISLAAVTGAAVAGIASGDGAPFDLAPVAPDRFS